MVKYVLDAQGHHDIFTPHDWKFEVLMKTIAIHTSRHNPCSAEVVSYAVAFLGASLPKSILQETKGDLSQETKGARPKSEKNSTNKTQEPTQNVSEWKQKQHL
jgi:hypothetical protein